MTGFTVPKVVALLQLAVISFALNTLVAFAQGECNVLGAPSVTTGSIAVADPTETNRMFRDGRATTCLFNRAQTTSAGSYQFKQHTFTNSSGGPECVQVELDATGCGVATNQISMAAYNATFNPASILTGVIADPGLSTGGSFVTSMAFGVPTGGTYVIVVHDVNAGTACPSYTLRRWETNNCHNPGFDKDNDGNADLAVYRPGASGTFFSQPIGGSTTTTSFGTTGDVPVTGDYNGDEASDLRVFRNGNWVSPPSTSTGFGLAGDVPVQGDYDHDGITDLAVYRPSTTTWYVLKSSDGTWLSITFGATGDKAVPADYDGDGRTDMALYRPSNGLWQVLQSAGNSASVNQVLWGLSTDIPVPGDYDGDGKADVAVFRPSNGTWYILRSSLTAAQDQYVAFGLAGDIPQPADYDGDRKVDQAVFRPSTGVWYVNRSTAGIATAQFGQNGDVPVSAPNPNTNQ